jgi:hypothetical protein
MHGDGEPHHDHVIQDFVELLDGSVIVHNLLEHALAHEGDFGPTEEFHVRDKGEAEDGLVPRWIDLSLCSRRLPAFVSSPKGTRRRTK